MSTRRFEFEDERSSKFWEITVDGTSVVTRWGKTGSKGQSRSKELASPEAAQTHADKKIVEKTRKGYAEVAVAQALELGARELRVLLLKHTFQVGQPGTDSATWAEWVEGRQIQRLRADLFTVSVSRAAYWVPVVLERHEEEPPLRAEPWCTVWETQLDLAAGDLEVSGDDWGEEQEGQINRFRIPPGSYGVRVHVGDEDTAEYDSAVGDDHYRVQLWPRDSGPVPAVEVDPGGEEPAAADLRRLLIDGDVCERVHAAHHVDDEDLLRSTLADPSVNVRIAAAASLIRLGHPDPAVALLGTEADPLDLRARIRHELPGFLTVDDSGVLAFVTPDAPSELPTKADWRAARENGQGVRMKVPPGHYLVEVRHEAPPEGALGMRFVDEWGMLWRWEPDRSDEFQVELPPPGRDRSDGSLEVWADVEPGEVLSRFVFYTGLT